MLDSEDETAHTYKHSHTMAHARYAVLVPQRRENGGTWDYTYYFFAQAVFLAREPSREEKVAFIQELGSRYKSRVLQAKRFECNNGLEEATKLVDSPTFALHDSHCLAGIRHCRVQPC